MSISVFDHPFLSGLLGDHESAQCFGTSADIAAMLRFELELVKAQAQLGIVPASAAAHIADITVALTPDIDTLKQAAARDGVVVPELVRQLRDAVGGEYAPYVHFGATSQDVIDTSLMLRLQQLCQIFQTRLERLAQQFVHLDQSFGKNRLTAYTRMQPAIEIRTHDRIIAWSAPLETYHQQLQNMVLPLQFGGAAGTLDRFGEKGTPLRALLAQNLGLHDRLQWHSQREPIAMLANLFSMITASLGKFGQDIALMAELGSEIGLRDGGGSSAMPHKKNPVMAEILVALARFNAVQLSGIHHAMVHEQERSGTAWTLEWMILPQMAAATGSALNGALQLTQAITHLGKD